MDLTFKQSIFFFFWDQRITFNNIKVKHSTKIIFTPIDTFRIVLWNKSFRSKHGTYIRQKTKITLKPKKVMTICQYNHTSNHKVMTKG